ncbi:UDP-GlcNAc:undecaprenyl-phosphate GlcNAc-1-phosphate transferase [Thiogranum longum]|uniref:UDP-GlcNAc:undecaprenyl-phosphate GlcNAc-1-phosphate transferase n=1 Tax=Thiogranum longum TaxID=1537524 RepID=A0A4R1HFP5_9GAMM|nr:MraY family glycosyltransferase [Thiogranum longum]TCK18159.1 UDP-GlcNAc:undecaprenyl-phosphate GlcNAc-1-phosphate transferase [Thiogranum longum]
MSNLLAFVAAIVISMVLIPLMSRVATRFGLVDLPSERKVHTTPVPRVGGVGIVIGTLVPVMLLLVPDNLIQSYVFGASVLFVFGLWDDAFEIGHYPKFVGQVIAALVVVLYGDLYVTRFPFLPGGEISPEFGIPFTLIAIVGMVNAMNHSDGLDGLAGGESLFTLGAIALLSFISADGMQAFTIAVASIGGILGFLRYNTHPARVFMGDSGSQFIGYTLAFLAILLTQKIDTSLSPAVVLLLLGLPIADILVVLAKRASRGKNIFRATRNHIHHRLLDLGFLHRESVIIIYSLQMIFVTTGVLMRHADNVIITATYLIYCLLVFTVLGVAERAGWKIHKSEQPHQARLTPDEFGWNILVVLPRRFLTIGISVFLISASLFIVHVPDDFAKMSLLVAFLIAVDLFTGYGQRTIMRRVLIYIIAAQVGFLWINQRPVWSNYAALAEVIVFALMSVAFIVAVKYSPRRRKIEFELTATDYLVAFSVLAVLITSRAGLWDVSSVAFVVQMVVILYSCELLITENRGKWSWLSAASMVAGLVLGVRGLLTG